MPTYDYECDACHHRFEEFQSMSDDPLKKCPACKKKKLRRLIGTGAAIIFKGSGFYQTDYRSESYKSAAKADEKPAATGTDSPATGGDKAKAADSAGSSGAESKAAAKTEPKKSKS